jgi:hypothetical protein
MAGLSARGSGLVENGLVEAASVRLLAGAALPAEHSLSRQMIAAIYTEFPRFRIVAKAGNPLSVAIDWALKLITVGAQRRYLSHYHTVIGDTLYVPPGWRSMSDVDRVILLRHERIHLRQRRRLGTFLMTVIYLLPFFPLGLAYGRAWIEWEAYRETLRATAELCGIDAARAPALKREIVRRFVGGDYGWMWPFRRQVEGWYDAAIERLAADLAAVHDDGAERRQQGG